MSYIVKVKNLFIILLICSCYNLYGANLRKELQIEFRWPRGVQIQDIGNYLDIFRDFRSYNQFLLIYNDSENQLLLQDVKVNFDDHEIIPSWTIPSKHIAVLLVKQESITLRCIEKFEFGERKASCASMIKAGLLPDTMVAKTNKPWVGNFSSINELDIEFRSIGIHLII